MEVKDMLNFASLFITGLFVLSITVNLLNYIIKRNDDIGSIKSIAFWSWLNIMMILLLIIKIIITSPCK